jgi:hypothetical protein
MYPVTIYLKLIYLMTKRPIRWPRRPTQRIWAREGGDSAMSTFVNGSGGGGTRV